MSGRNCQRAKRIGCWAPSTRLCSSMVLDNLMLSPTAEHKSSLLDREFTTKHRKRNAKSFYFFLFLSWKKCQEIHGAVQYSHRSMSIDSDTSLLTFMAMGNWNLTLHSYLCIYIRAQHTCMNTWHVFHLSAFMLPLQSNTLRHSNTFTMFMHLRVGELSLCWIA